jgi:outer membrane protein assembly factor BamB
MRIRPLWLLTALVLASSLAVAADWPQWRGPERGGVSKETGLLQSWPKDGPPLAWTFDNAGTGFGSFAVVGGRVYVLGARKVDGKRVEQVIALDDKGVELWSAPIGPMYDWDGNQWSGGPNSTPAVDGDLVFALGSQGELVCVTRSDGKVKWRKNLPDKLDAEVSPGPGGPDKIGWGYNGSPLVDGDRLICTPGGPKGLFAALDKTSGEVLWRSKDLTDACTYSSPVAAEVKGVRQYVALTQNGAAGVSAKDGATLWEYRRDLPFPDVACPTPLVKDDLVYLTAWGGGGTLLKLTPDGNKFKAEVVYQEKEIASRHGGVVLVDGFIYGNHDQRDWVCQDFATGAVRWRTKPAAAEAGTLIYADGRLYTLSEGKGDVALVEATADGYKEAGRFTLPKKSGLRKPSGKIWAHPAISDGKLYLRDQEYVFCYKIAK